jgi:hypothetical protein
VKKLVALGLGLAAAWVWLSTDDDGRWPHD